MNGTERQRPELLLDAGRRVWRIRVIQLVSIVFLVFAGVLGWLSLFHMRTETGAELEALWLRIMMGGAILIVGFGFVAATFGYGLHYVARMERLGDTIRVWTVAPWGVRQATLPVGDVLGGRVYAPVIHARGQIVDAPWRTLNIRGRRFPFVIDLQAGQIDRAGIASLNTEGQ